MRNAYDCVPAHKGNLIMLSICAVFTGVLVLLGFDGNPPIATAPRILLCASIIGLYTQAKKIVFSPDVVEVRYLLFRRRIDWDRVRGIEFAHQQSRYYIMIRLDNCPLWDETNMSLRNYISVHPIKLVAIRIESTQLDKYKEMVQRHCSKIHKT